MNEMPPTHLPLLHNYRRLHKGVNGAMVCKCASGSKGKTKRPALCSNRVRHTRIKGLSIIACYRVCVPALIVRLAGLKAKEPLLFVIIITVCVLPA